VKRIVKIVTFYDDGTFTESIPYVGAPMPTGPYPGTTPLPYIPSDPYTPTFTKCSKCGLNLEKVMGYVCPNNPCPCGMGGVYCKAEV
jgi:hypothetical protein